MKRHLSFLVDHSCRQVDAILNLKVYGDEITLNVIENEKLEVEKENHYQVSMIRTNVKRQSNIPT